MLRTFADGLALAYCAHAKGAVVVEIGREVLAQGGITPLIRGVPPCAHERARAGISPKAFLINDVEGGPPTVVEAPDQC